MKSKRRSGFTLMEVLLVMAILVVMASLVTFAFLNIQQNANRDAAFNQASLLSRACTQYKMNTRQFPNKLDDLIALPTGMSERKWKGPYLDTNTIPQDPWGNPYEYVPDLQNNRVSIISNGPDGQKGTPDDINSSQKDN